MFSSRTATTHRLMIFLVAFSGLGTLVAGQQYMSLHLEETMISTRQTLEKSFLSDLLREVESEAPPEIAQRLADRKTTIATTYSGATAAIRYLKIRAMADFIGWCLVLVIAGVALVLTRDKKPKQDDPHAVSPAANE